MAHIIRVEPLGDGWSVSADQVANPMPFKSGAAAELAARTLAAKLSAAGVDAEIQIILRDGSVGARVGAPR